MARNLSRKVTAVLLTLSMILSLLLTPGFAKEVSAVGKAMIVRFETQVSNGNTLVWVDGFTPKEVLSDVSRVRVSSTTINGTQVPIIEGTDEIVFYNGEYWMDPDEPIYPRTPYMIMYRFKVADPSIFYGVTSFQFYLGGTAYNESGYAWAEARVEGNMITLTAQTMSYSLEISQEAVSAIDYDITYGETLPTKVKLLNGSPYTAGTARWSYCDYNTITNVTKANRGADGVNTYYMLEVTLQSKNQFIFNTGLNFYNMDYPDGRRLFVEVMDKGKSAKVIIEGIVPREPEVNTMAIKEITMSTQMSFGTNEANLAVDVIAKLPKSIKITLEGSDTPINLPLVFEEQREIKWYVYEMVSGALVEEGDVLEKGDDKKYVAYYPMAGIEQSLEEAGYTDSYGLFDVYQYDGDFEHQGGYSIIFSVRPQHPTTSQPQNAFAATDAPVFTFTNQGGYCMYSVSGYAPYSCKCVANLEAFIPGQTDVTCFPPTPCSMGQCGDTIGVFKAMSKGIANQSVDSPIVYRMFDPDEFRMSKMQNGVVSVSLQKPETDAIATKEAYVAATGDFAAGLNLDMVSLTWRPRPIAINSDSETFDADTAYVAEIKIPVRAGFTIEKIPQVRLNGVLVDDVEANGNYLVITYTFPKTDPEYWINRNGVCNKKMYFTTPVPFIGAYIPDRVEFSDGSGRIIGNQQITWYEDTTKVEGGVFKKGARYTMVLTVDMNEAGVMHDLSGVNNLVGTQDYVTGAYASASTGLLTINFDFGVCEKGNVGTVNDYSFTMPNGISEEDFEARLKGPHFAEVSMSDGSVSLFEIEPGFNENGVQYQTIFDQYQAEYFGAFQYDKEEKTEQVFTLTCNVDLSDNGGDRVTPVNVTIVVSAVMCHITFDLNGGEKSSSFKDQIVVPYGKELGFKYKKSDCVREGYLFAGWYTDPVKGIRVYSSTSAEGDETLYAHWTKITLKKRVILGATCKKGVKIDIKVKKLKEYADGVEIYFTAVNGAITEVFKDGDYTHLSDIKVFDLKVSAGNTVKDKITVSRLKSKTVYYIAARPYKYDSTGKKVYGPLSGIKKVKTKKK